MEKAGGLGFWLVVLRSMLDDAAGESRYVRYQMASRMVFGVVDIVLLLPARVPAGTKFLRSCHRMAEQMTAFLSISLRCSRGACRFEAAAFIARPILNR